MSASWWARYKAIPSRSRVFLGMFGVTMALGGTCAGIGGGDGSAGPSAVRRKRLTCAAGMTAMQYYDLSEEGQERLRQKKKERRGL